MKNIAKNIDREMGIIIFLLLVILSLWFLQQYLINNLYISGLGLDNMNTQTTQLKLDNNGLLLIYLQKTSYSNIASEAASMGFVKAPIVTP